MHSLLLAAACAETHFSAAAAETHFSAGAETLLCWCWNTSLLELRHTSLLVVLRHTSGESYIIFWWERDTASHQVLVKHASNFGKSCICSKSDCKIYSRKFGESCFKFWSRQGNTNFCWSIRQAHLLYKVLGYRGDRVLVNYSKRGLLYKSNP